MKNTKKYNSSKPSPVVSVIMPVYNAQAYVGEAIESILAQTYRNFELIIIDDASTDASWRIIRKYAKAHPEFIRAHRLDKNINQGGDACANIALELARGAYIARMDADDIAYPARLAKQVAYLSNHPTCSLVGGSADVIDKNGVIIGEKIEPSSHEQIYKSYFTFHPIIHPSCMYRRKWNKKPFAYMLRYSANNDYYTFFTHMCQGARYHNLPEKLLKYRIHSQNDTFVNIKQKYLNTLAVRIKMCTKHGYRPTPKQVLTTCLQTVVLLTLPERMITKLYFIAKGIVRIPVIGSKTIVAKAFFTRRLNALNRLS